MVVDCNIKSLIINHDLESGASTCQLSCSIFGEVVILDASPRMVSIIENVLRAKEDAPGNKHQHQNWGLAELEDPEEVEQA